MPSPSFIDTYFNAEKAESLLFVVVGLGAIAFGLYGIFKIKESFYTGLAIPLVLIALIQLTVGSTVYLRTDKQAANLKALYQLDRATFKVQEIPRMEMVNKNFDLYRYIEMGFVVTGLLLMTFLRERDFWLGVGVGMLMQGALMLSLDIFAERRADVYTEIVQQV